MRLTIVGCAGSFPGPDAPASCYLVEAEAEGRTWRILLDLGSGALGALLVLTGPGPYPVSMLGLPGQEVSNMLPPSVCVIAVGVVQLGLVMLARPALLRWLERPRAWRTVVAANSAVMTLFLWHITGLVLAAGAAYLAGLALPPIGSARY